MPKSLVLQNEPFSIEQKKREALATLDKLHGSVKIKRHLTKAESDKLAISLDKDKEKEFLRRFRD